MERSVAATVGGNGRVGRDPNGEEQARPRHRLDGIDVAFHLRGGAGEVGEEVAAVDGDGDGDGQIDHSPFHDIGEVVFAVRQTVECRSHPTFTVVEQGATHRREAVGSLGIDQSFQTKGAGLVRPDLGRQVAATFRRGSRGGEERVDEVGAPRAVLRGHGRVDPMPLLIHRDGVGRHRSGGLTANIGMVRPVGHPGDEPPSVEHRPNQGQIVEVCSPGIGVVDRVLRPGIRFASESFDDGCDRGRHRAEVDGDVLCLRKHLARRHEDRGRAIGALLDVRRECRAPQHHPHVVGEGGEAAASDLEAGGIDTYHVISSAPES